MARALNKKRIGCIGVVFPNAIKAPILDPYFGSLLDGIVRVTSDRSHNLTLCTGTEWDGRTSLPMFRDRLVDGLILIATHTDSDIVTCLTAAGIPFVLISSGSDDPSVSSVDTDNFDAARNVVHHLAALGHTRIAHLGGRSNSPSTPLRRAGYLRGLQDCGLHIDPSLIAEGAYSCEWGYEGMTSLLSLPNPPTAVFAGGDGIALGVYRACDEAGVRIPDDLSVVGFDNASFVKHMNPGLTTVHHPLIEIGNAAADLLLRMLDANDIGHDLEAEHITLKSEMIYRESVGPAAVKPAKTRRAPIRLVQMGQIRSTPALTNVR
jgi:LacI family transcriptional regulator